MPSVGSLILAPIKPEGPRDAFILALAVATANEMKKPFNVREFIITAFKFNC